MKQKDHQFCYCSNAGRQNDDSPRLPVLYFQDPKGRRRAAGLEKMLAFTPESCPGAESHYGRVPTVHKPSYLSQPDGFSSLPERMLPPAAAVLAPRAERRKSLNT